MTAHGVSSLLFLSAHGVSGLLFSHVLHRRPQVVNGTGHAGELFVLRFGDLDAVALAELHHDVQKIHAVELELLAERLLIDEGREVFVGGDVGKDIEDFLADFGVGHCYEDRDQWSRLYGVYLRMMTAELMPSMPKELLRMWRTGPISLGWPMTSVRRSHSGSSSSTLIVAWQTPSSKAPKLPANSSEPAAPMA